MRPNRPITVSLAVALTLIGVSSGQSGQAAPSRTFSVSPLPQQPIESTAVLALLDRPDKAIALLRTAKFAEENGRPYARAMWRKKPTEPAVMFRLQLVDDKGRPVEVFFKPQQKNYRDWKTEIAACRLAHALGIRAIPCADRAISRSVVADALRQLPQSLVQQLQWSGPKKDQLYGFVRLWSTSYRSQIGPYTSDKKSLLALVHWLHPKHRQMILSSDILQDLSDTVVFDFLIYNNDRKNNLGAIRNGPSSVRLFAIDFGDGLSSSPANKQLYKEVFNAVKLLRADLIARIEQLSIDKLTNLWQLENGNSLLVEPAHLTHVMQQRKLVVEHVATLKKTFKESVTF